MRHFDSSRPFEISLGLSLLLHLCLFLYFYYYNPDSFKEVENPPISVEYISPHKDELKIEKPFSGGDKKGTVAKLKAGKPGAPMPTSTVPRFGLETNKSVLPRLRRQSANVCRAAHRSFNLPGD